MDLRTSSRSNMSRWDGDAEYIAVTNTAELDSCKTRHRSAANKSAELAARKSLLAAGYRLAGLAENKLAASKSAANTLAENKLAEHTAAGSLGCTRSCKLGAVPNPSDFRWLDQPRRQSNRQQ